MFTTTPQEKPYLSWILFLLWSFIIFAAIPLARSIESFITRYVSTFVFTYIVIAAVVISSAYATLCLRRQKVFSADRYIWLACVATVLIGYTLKLSRTRIEAMHFIQYGFLGLLAFRALSHHIRDNSIYFVSALLCGIIGICDEFIQWLTPDRFWGLGDIWINFLGAALVQIGIAKGIRPAYIMGRPHRNNLRICCRLGILATSLLGISLINSPSLIAWYAERIPVLSFLKNNESVMLEYGYLYNDPEIGIFRSRLSPESLKIADANRSAEAADILDQYKDKSVYNDFLNAYTPLSDPFVHEARVHLFQRNYYFVNALHHQSNSQTYAEYLTIAYRENQIMEKYFPNTLHHSAYVWSDEQLSLARRHLLRDKPYESRVSHSLVTRINAEQMAIVFLLILGLLIIYYYVLGQKPKPNRQQIAPKR